MVNKRKHIFVFIVSDPSDRSDLSASHRIEAQDSPKRYNRISFLKETGPFFSDEGKNKFAFPLKAD